MPIAKIQLPDGRTARFEVPEGTTEQEVLDFAETMDFSKSAPEGATDADDFQPTQRDAQPPQGYQKPSREVVGGYNPEPEPVELTGRQKAMQELAEEQGPFRSAAIGAGRSFYGLGRMAGIVPPEDETEKEAYQALSKERPISTAIGEALPFVAPSVLTGGIPSLAGRAAATGTLGAVESAALGGEDERGEKAAAGAAIGAGAEIAIPVIGRVAGKAIKRLAGISPDANLYDNVGNLTPEAKAGIDRAGITEDEIREAIPPQSPKTQAEALAGKVSSAAGGKVGVGRKTAALAEEVKPSKEILEAEKELGLETLGLASHSSGNPIYRAIEQELKSVPGSKLAAQERARIEELAQKADSLITEFGGELDKTALSSRFKSESLDVVSKLQDRADVMFGDITKAINPRLRVDAANIVKSIQKHADDLGGEEYLTKEERILFSSLSPDKNPTYARLDEARKNIGAALDKKEGPFRNLESSRLKSLYSGLAKDQEAAAISQGVGDMYKTANILILARKGIEKQLTSTLGRDLMGNIAAQAGVAVKALGSGQTKHLDKMLANIPAEVGPDMRKSIIITALNDAFTQGARAEKSLSISGFDNFMTGLNRHGGARSKLESEIGVDAMKRLGLLHKVVGGIREAQKDAMAVPRMFDERKNIASRVYGAAKKIVPAEVASTASGIPGVGTAAVIGGMLAAGRTARSVAADDLLASPQFQDVVMKKASGVLNTKSRSDAAQKAITRTAQFRRWEKTITKEELAQMSRVGALAFITATDEEND